MGTLIRYELKKILCNRAGMVACACAYLLLVGITVANILTAGIWDTQTGTYVTGMRAQEVIRHMEQGHAGVLDDARVAADMATYDEAQARWAADAERLGGMSGQQIIDEYGIEFWREVDRVRSDVYYLRLDSILTLDDKGARASSLQEGAETLTDHMLSGNYLGYFPYSDAEQGYWKAKAAQISWPLEYGYAGAWDTISSYLSFYGFVVLATCIALSGVFTGEYRDRTAAIVLPTLRGRQALPRAKVAASFAFATVYYWLSVASTAGIVLAALGPEGASLPYQVLDFQSPYPLTVGQVCGLVILLGWLVSLGCTAFTLLLSSRMRSTMPVAVVPLAIAFLGVFAELIVPLTKVAHLTPLNAFDDSFVAMASYAVGPLVLDLPSAAALLYGTLLLTCVPIATRSFTRHQVA
ncbi:MAG: ABC transporter [Acidobacteriota bacterium]|nr:ABC transporter [Acidobacteriota bacterium]